MKSFAVIYLYVVSMLLFVVLSAHAAPLSKKGCQDRCGDVIITYPFGIGLQCSANQFFVVVCINSTTPSLRSIDRQILNISVGGSVVIKQRAALLECNGQRGTGEVPLSLWGSPFTISGRYNTLVVVGCNNVVWLHANKTTIVGGCSPPCDGISIDGTCSGGNCCHITIPSRFKKLDYTFKIIKESSGNASSCGHVFGVKKNWLNKSKSYKGLVRDGFGRDDTGFAPLVLEWEFGGLKSTDYSICKYHGDEVDYVSTVKYCSCRQGFEGNPYIPQGCVDIDECNANKTHDPCVMSHKSCKNTNGSYVCEDPNGKFKTRLRILFFSIAISLVVAILLLVAWKSTSRVLGKRIEARRRRTIFKSNGGLLLEQQLSATNNGIGMTKLYSSKELKIATNHYSEDQILGSGAFGTVYKGVLTDGRIVAVKKPQEVEKGDIRGFINEVCILSQVNHRNVVKLLGCCLETKVPILVYEFISNGTLHQHIHRPNEDSLLTWKKRLMIAKEVATSVAYLHSAASAPVYHRDIKSKNILLDDNYHAKVADFGTSRLVPIDQTRVVSRQYGTPGYMAPENAFGIFTEKSDVYSFGVVMAELLTSKKAVEANDTLQAQFLTCMEEDRLVDILDANIKREGEMEELIRFAELARRCVQKDGSDRPTMTTVAMELEAIVGVKKTTPDEESSSTPIKVDELGLLKVEFLHIVALGKSRTVDRELHVIKEGEDIEEIE